MISYVQHENIDKSRWDDCIEHAANGNLVSRSWFLDIVSPGWCALIADDYEAVFPLTAFSRLGIRYLMQPYFTQQLGLFYRSLSTKDLLQNFLELIPAEYKYIDINLNSSNNLPSGIHISGMINLELNLCTNYQEITAGYQNNLKRNLKKAEQNHLVLRKNKTASELIALFKANKGQDLKHLTDKQYLLIQNIAGESLKREIGEIWEVFSPAGNLLAGVLWVTSHSKTILLFSAVSDEGKKLNAMPWLIDYFIRENAGKNLLLDFEGSNNVGLARFYSSFGAGEVLYYRYTRNHLPMQHRIALKLWRLIRNL